jgi:hypothetical protein
MVARRAAEACSGSLCQDFRMVPFDPIATREQIKCDLPRLKTFELGCKVLNDRIIRVRSLIWTYEKRDTSTWGISLPLFWVRSGNLISASLVL